LADGGSIYFDGDLAEGSAVFTDEEMEAPVADGEYALGDGRTVNVTDGSVTSISAADTENKDMDEINAKVEALETSNTELKESNEALKEGQESIAEALNALSAGLKDLKNFVPGDDGKGKKVDKKYEDMTNIEKLHYNRMN